MICSIFLIMGFAFAGSGLSLLGLAHLLLIAPAAGLLLYFSLRLLRRLLGRLSALLALVIGLLLPGVIIVSMLNDISNEKSLPPVLFVGAVTCFLVYGLCLSTPAAH
jgi:hypothetical protein